MNKHTYHLMESNRRRPWTLETLEALQVRCQPFRGWEFKEMVIGPPVTQRKRCFTSVFFKAVVSLLSSRPIRHRVKI
uniref:SFRICE_010018 n=1 Tax=Spodoptera frugiperda TaxID=7108 RepID=A0A2H1W581_SPOFR